MTKSHLFSDAEVITLAIAIYESAIRCRKEAYAERGEYLPTQLCWTHLSPIDKDKWRGEAINEINRYARYRHEVRHKIIQKDIIQKDNSGKLSKPRRKLMHTA